MTDEEVVSFAAGQLAAYVEERVASGEDREDATRIATDQTNAVLPGGRPAEGHLLYRLVDDHGTAVGSVWIGPPPGGLRDMLWVWYVEVDPAYRGRGLGRAAMVLIEEEARSRGAAELRLNVFGHNTTARRLYESIGYETTAITMRKRLSNR